MNLLKALGVAFLFALILPCMAEAGLSPDIMKDKYLIELSDHLKHERFSEALPYFDKLRTLKKKHKLKLPVSLLYFEGEALFHTGYYFKADDLLTSYVNGQGKQAKFYSQALELLIALDTKKEEQLQRQRQEAEDKRLAEKRLKEEALAMKAAIAEISHQMVVIPAGKFRMGGKEKDEKPKHNVQISSFKMSKYEVTQLQWRGIMGGNPSNFKGDNNPVERVSWDDVQIFIGKLNKKTGQTFRLPSEAEWEYAARAGTKTKWSWGNDEGSAGSYAWYRSNSGIKTHPVGQKQPNGFGLYEMHGNAWEWVQDCWNNNYRGAPKHGEAWLSGGCSGRVLRGGSWRYDPASARSANRYWNSSGARNVYSGFRLVQD